MGKFFKVITFSLSIIFYPLKYLFRKLPFATRRKLISNTTGFLGFVGKASTIIQHVFLQEKGIMVEMG